MAGREVRAQAADLRDNRYYDPTTRTDADGHYELKFVRSGPQNIQAAPFWFPGQTPESQNWPVDIKEGQTFECPDLVVPRERSQ